MSAGLLSVSFGGGVNSTAMLVEMFRRSIRPDVILFADTGGERPETYDCLRKVTDWCVAHGFPAITTVRHESKKHGDKTLEDEVLRTRNLPSIAYGFKTCSQKWKGYPQDKWLKSFAPALACWASGGKVVKAIGYDAGEARRGKPYSDDEFDVIYPLIEWGIYREDCVAICKSEGLPIAKSSCFFCPSMKRWEIRDLTKTNPELIERALNIEANANLISVAGLGRSFSWKDLLAADKAQRELFDDFSAPEIPCGCYDG
jgi:hypothetical protein